MIYSLGFIFAIFSPITRKGYARKISRGIQSGNAKNNSSTPEKSIIWQKVAYTFVQTILNKRTQDIQLHLPKCLVFIRAAAYLEDFS